MVLFSIYAVIVWFAAARYRRQWGSFASVAAGLAGLILIALLHIQLSRWTNGRIFLPVLQAMLYPYIGLVALVGLYLSCLPRAMAATACRACEYDLTGLAADRVVCPECGREASARELAAIAREAFGGRAMAYDRSHGSPRRAVAPDLGPAPDRKRVIRARFARGRPRPASAPAAPGSPAIAASPVFLRPGPG